MPKASTVHLVPLRWAEDRPVLSEHLAEYWRDLGARPDPEWHRAYLERLEQEDGRGRNAFWGQQGTSRVGLVVLRLDRDWVRPELRIGYVAEFTVFRPWRRRGLGRQMFAAAAQWLRGHDCALIELDVLATNATGMAFWRAMGFATAYHHLRLESGRG